ncbi:putative 2-oxoglutarate dehydrogenase E1 component DHKTD1-like protein, mitochondrial [Aphelenchoides fujianensis]|nr:putative 2-oxoglutarate dehydrogenase E1 component DHKTD1-like protein, mitochondrial [Aphelenchoides fujianensis]
MVKLFVGNLAEGIDSHRLRNLFLQYVQVQECDVLKNFAFVHVISDDDAQIVIDKLDKYNLEGREIHIERSTSRLRKEPGMSDKCFTCGAHDHKTPNCPQEQGRKKKRGLDMDERPDGKKPAVLPTINLAGGGVMGAPAINWGCKVGGGSDGDPELPCPTNPELRTLYDQYLESRTRYFYYRERLSKELSLQPQAAQPMHVGRIDMTRAPQMIPAAAPKPVAMMPQAVPAAQPTIVQYAAPQQPQQQVYASAPQQIVASYATSAPSYATVVTSMPQQQAAAVPGQPAQFVSIPPASIAPAAPYNTMARPQAVSYAVQPPAGQQIVVQQNGQPVSIQPSAPYASSSAPYRTSMPMYSTISYSSVQTAPR